MISTYHPFSALAHKQGSGLRPTSQRVHQDRLERNVGGGNLRGISFGLFVAVIAAAL